MLLQAAMVSFCAETHELNELLPYIMFQDQSTHCQPRFSPSCNTGYPEAWWLPAANDIPPGYATEGTYYESAHPVCGPGAGCSVDDYTNDQPTTALWYHDHAIGITRLNVYAGGAGFWLIRTKNDRESGLKSGALPGPAPKLGQDPNGDPAVRNKIREIPIVIQPKV